MKSFKKNYKLIVGFIVGIILASGICVYATYTYLASEVTYVKNGNVITVEKALDDLYIAKQEFDNNEINALKSQLQTLSDEVSRLQTNVTDMQTTINLSTANNSSFTQTILYTSTGLSSGTVSFVEGKHANDYTFLLVTCATEQGYIYTLIPREQIGVANMMARFSDNNVNYCSRIKFVINDTSVSVTDYMSRSNCYCKITRIVGIN